jgi:hypothetical protein
LIAISLCLTVTILEMIKLNKQAKEEALRQKRDMESRARRQAEGPKSFHEAQNTDEFWMYDEGSSQAPQSSRSGGRKFLKARSSGSSVEDKDSDKMLTPSRRRELQARAPLFTQWPPRDRFCRGWPGPNCTSYNTAPLA